MWKLYDGLIRRAGQGDAIKEVITGESWTMVTTVSGNVGIAASYAKSPQTDVSGLIGLPLDEAAALVKSWDFSLAAVGLAAINSRVNSIERFKDDSRNPDAFIRYRGLVTAKKVAVIGRFAYLENRLSGICDLYVLERNPGPGDYPDSACEYLLPSMDAVFITGSAITNKTMPRLLELSQNAFTVISGPSTCMDESLFDMGADALCGFCVTDEALCRVAVSQCAKIFSCGRMVCYER